MPEPTPAVCMLCQRSINEKIDMEVKRIDDKFLMCQKNRDDRLSSIIRETDLVAKALNDRLHSMNNLQAQMDKQAEHFTEMSGKYVTRAELLAVAVGVSTFVSAVVVIVMHLMGK